MFKIETFVKWVVISVIAAATLPPSVAAAEKDSVIKKECDYDSLIEGYEKDLAKGAGADAEKLKAKIQELRDKKENCLDIKATAEVGGCEDSEKEFLEAKGKFETACSSMPGKAKVRAGGERGKPVACSDAILRCNCMFAERDSTEWANYGCSQGDQGEGGSKSRASSYDLSKIKQKYEWCPALASSDSEQLRKDVEDSRKRLREIEKEQSGLRDKAIEAQNKGEEKQAELAEKAMADQKEGAAKISELKKEKDSKIAQVMAEAVQLQAQGLALNAKIAEQQLGNNKHDYDYNQAINQVEMNCHSQALQRVTEEQKLRAQELYSRVRSRGGFAATAGKFGITERQRWQRLAKEYYRECLRSDPTKRAKKSASDARELAFKATKASVATLEEERTAIRGQIDQIQNSKDGCGAPGPNGQETKICQATRQAEEDIRQAKIDSESQRILRAQTARQAQSAAARQSAALMQEMAANKREINEEKARLREKEEFLALKNQYGAGDGAGGNASYQNARDKYSDFSGKAHAQITCCAKAGKSFDGGSCAEAKGFIESIYQEPETVIEGLRRAAETNKPLSDPKIKGTINTEEGKATN